MSLVTDVTFQAWLSIAGITTTSAERDLLLPFAEQTVQTMLKRNLELQWHNETITIPRHRTYVTTIKLKNYPITASSLMLTETSSLLNNITDLIIEESTAVITLRSDTRYWDTGRDAVLAMYQGGYSTSTLPADLQRLICKAGIAVKSMPGVVYATEKIGDYSYKTASSMLEDGLDSVDKSVVSKYKKVW